jgi:DNA-binding response OmpR family regulator
MRKPPASGIDSGMPVTVLSVSPITEDHTLLTDIFDRSERLLSGASRYILCPCATLKSAIAALSQAQIQIVVTERDLATGSWRDVLNSIFLLPDPPILIVTSRLADEYLWAEALNLGAYDVLAKPFDVSEVKRVVDSAWRHWADLRTRIQVRNTKPMAATTAA